MFMSSVYALSLQSALFSSSSFTGMLAYSQGLSAAAGYHHMMSQHHNPYTTTTPPVTGTESSLYTPPFTPIKMEYPCGLGPVSSCMQMQSSSYMVPPPPPPASLSMPTTCAGHIVEPSTAYSTSISSTGRSLQDGHISEVCRARVGWVVFFKDLVKIWRCSCGGVFCLWSVFTLYNKENGKRGLVRNTGYTKRIASVPATALHSLCKIQNKHTHMH